MTGISGQQADGAGGAGGATVPAASVLAEVVRQDWGRLLALLAGRFRRLDLAGDALADAVAAAARHWPDRDAPANPPAWILTTARRRVLDRLRAEAVAAKAMPTLVGDLRTTEHDADTKADAGDEVSDELLRLVFCCAHPALDPAAAAALTLRLVLGVPTTDIARLFLVSEPTMAARITRAKRKIVTAGVPFSIPPPGRIGERLEVLADVAYLAFTAGYAPGSGSELLRVDLAGDAIRLVRLVRRSLPDSPVLAALLALMLLQHSRRDARTDAAGRVVLLADQDRSRWYHDEIAEATALLTPLLDSAQPDQQDPAVADRCSQYLLQALIAAEHAVAPSAAATNWRRIAGWYAELETRTGSPIVRLNRAVAVAEGRGPGRGPLAALALLEGLDEKLPISHRLPAVRAELLLRVGDRSAANEQFDLAIARCANIVEADHLRRRRDGGG